MRFCLNLRYNTRVKKILWAVQSLDRLGGTETVSIRLMNLLCKDYEVTLVCSSEIEGDVLYPLDPSIKVVPLHIDSKIGRFDQFWASYGWKHPLKRLALFQKTVNAYFWGRPKRQKYIASLMDEDTVFIASSIDSYRYAPSKNKGKVFFHYHFDAPSFEKDNVLLRTCRKPDHYVFLTESTLKEVCEKHPNFKGKCSYIYNPIKFAPQENYESHGHEIIFVGRFTEQKDPMLALAVALELKNRGFSFHMKMYGDGHLAGDMHAFIGENGLENEVEMISGESISERHYLASDMMLITSAYEGFSLVKFEANACSLPVVTSRFSGPIDEVFHDGEDGYIVPSHDPKDYADKIIALLEDPYVLKEAKRKAFLSSKRFSEDSIVEEWKKILG